MDTCTWRECNRPRYHGDLCNMHRIRKKRGQDMDAPHRYETCKQPECKLRPHTNGLCQYHLTNPPKESGFSVYRIVFENGKSYIGCTGQTVSDRIKEHQSAKKSTTYRLFKSGYQWSCECLHTGLTRKKALEIEQEEIAKQQKPLNGKIGRPKTSDLVIFSVKIPRKLQAQLDRAACNSGRSRNMIIRHILEQYFKTISISKGGERMRPHERQRAIDAGRAIRKALSTADFPYKSLTRAFVEARELAGFLDAVNALLMRVDVAHDFSDILKDWTDDRWQESRAVMMCVVLSK